MSAPWVLAIDLGTHAARAIAFNPAGDSGPEASRDVRLFRYSADIVEQDPLDIINAVQDVIQKVCSQIAASRGSIIAAGLATQRSSVVAWDRQSSQPLSPVISWQDRRNEKDLQELKKIENHIQKKTGLPVSPHYGANKLRSLLKSNPEVKKARKEGRLAFGPLASWVLFHLVEGSPFVTDDANASRTLLWNITTRNWDEELLQRFEIPKEALPVCRPIVYDYGKLKGYDIPLQAVSGDQNAALFARGAPRHGETFANIGTGAFILQPTGRLVLTTRLLSGINFSCNPEAHEPAPVPEKNRDLQPRELPLPKGQPAAYHIEGTVNGAGAALNWFYETYCNNSAPSNEEITLWLTEIQNPPLFLNTIGGVGSPWWKTAAPRWINPEGKPVKPDTREAVCSIIESILFMLTVNFKEMKAARKTIDQKDSISISGGLAHFDELCRKFASLTGADIHRFEQSEATARGIAWLAAGSSCNWSRRPEKIFSPKPDGNLMERFQQFHLAMDQL